MEKTTGSYPLLREAYAIIDGIPSDRIDLENFANKTDPFNCGTIACAAGWLCMHPSFTTAFGIGLNCTDGDLKMPTLHGVIHSGTYRWGSDNKWDTMLASVFGTSVKEAFDLFCTRQTGSPLDPDYDDDGMTDKQVWQYRVREFLRIKDAEVSAGQ